eukprot:TRINITY_DN9148_c0_g1_i2.p2 TRINITY_DN9148_c0_g1~~TRINITY_DN9148_c0_g1_i2.p2  ORF type:complete len:117 (-),score=29.68 TRINITY_DN9148_c0_g1_i2:325-675(-)
MRHEGLSLLEAFRCLRSQRPAVAPNEGFFAQLELLEVAIFGGPSSFPLRDYCVLRLQEQMPVCREDAEQALDDSENNFSLAMISLAIQLGCPSCTFLNDKDALVCRECNAELKVSL